MCDAMFIYAIERAEAKGNLPVIPQWDDTDSTNHDDTANEGMRGDKVADNKVVDDKAHYISDDTALAIIEREVDMSSRRAA